MHAALSELNTKPKALEINELYFLQSLSEMEVQSAQLWKLFSIPQVLTLHQVAFTFPLQPGHFPET